MKNKLSLTIILLTVLAALFAIPAAAGGWAVITLDTLPPEINPGEILEIGFMVRQHGIRPLEGLSPIIMATHTETGETAQVAARAQGPTGHYTAELTLPRAGRWDWSIRAFTMDQPMPPLTIRITPGASVPTSGFQFSPFWLAVPALIAVVAALALFTRKRAHWAAMLVLALLFTGGGFALASNQPEQQVPAIKPTLSSVSEGEALFLAKGCITCHPHAALAARYEVTSGFSGPAGSAPDLTDYVSSPDFLQVWLANPQQVKPDTGMPNLGLTETEISALIAFLISEPSAVPVEAPSDFHPKSCPVTQPMDPVFIPPNPYPKEAASSDQFWYGTDGLWTMLSVDGTWRGLPYHQGQGGHYVNKVFWWSEGYDWQVEPEPTFTVTAQRLDNKAPNYESTEATNAYTPEFGSAILTGVEIPTPGCWEFTGYYQDYSLSFVVWVAP